MVKVAKNGRKCSYGECQLPDNNKRYFWQFVYIVFGVICLATDEKSFSFFSLFTFVAPVLIDLLGGDISRKPAKYFRQFFICLDILVVLVCFSGWYGFLEDTGSEFVVTADAMFSAGAAIPKTWMLGVIVLNVFVPVMYGKASPCKRKADITFAAMAVESKR